MKWSAPFRPLSSSAIRFDDAPAKSIATEKGRRAMSVLPPIATEPRTSLKVRKKCQRRKSPLLFDHLVATGEHLDAIVIRAARLAAILLRIAQDLRHAARGPARI